MTEETPLPNSNNPSVGPHSSHRYVTSAFPKRCFMTRSTQDNQGLHDHGIVQCMGCALDVCEYFASVHGDDGLFQYTCVVFVHGSR